MRLSQIILLDNTKFIASRIRRAARVVTRLISTWRAPVVALPLALPANCQEIGC